MNFNELRDRFLQVGKTSLEALSKQLKEVMTGESYNKFLAFVKKQQEKSDRVMSFGKEIIGF